MVVIGTLNSKVEGSFPKAVRAPWELIVLHFPRFLAGFFLVLPAKYYGTRLGGENPLGCNVLTV